MECVRDYVIGWLGDNVCVRWRDRCICLLGANTFLAVIGTEKFLKNLIKI